MNTFTVEQATLKGYEKFAEIQQQIDAQPNLYEARNKAYMCMLGLCMVDMSYNSDDLQSVSRVLSEKVCQLELEKNIQYLDKLERSHWTVKAQYTTN